MVVDERQGILWPIVKGVAVGLGAPWFFMVAGPFSYPGWSGVFLATFGVSLGWATYCLERARTHLTDEWLELHGTDVVRRWSWSVEDYDQEGKRWVWRWRQALGASLLTWFVANVLAL